MSEVFYPPTWAGAHVTGWQDRALELGWPEPETSPDGALAGHLGALESDLAQTRVERHRRGRELYEGVGRPLVVLAVRAEVILYRDASGQVCALGHPERALGLSAASWARDLGIPEHIDPPRPPGLPSSAQLRAAQKGTKTLWKRERFGPTDELGTLAARTSPKDELGSFEAPEHRCHADGCGERVPPKLLMCARHWRMVPAKLQADVWRTYRPGQETDKHPSREYVDAARAAIESIAQTTPAPSAGLRLVPPQEPRELAWIDTETTGKSPALHQVIELAVAITDLEGNVLRAPAGVLVALEPWSARDLSAIAVHHIDWRKPGFATRAQPMKDVLERAFARLAGRRIAGHNVSFDVGFLKASAQRCGIATAAELAAPTLDTLPLARELKKRGLLRVDSCGLGALRAHFGVGHEAHRATGDVAANIEIYRRLRALESNAGAARPTGEQRR